MRGENNSAETYPRYPLLGLNEVDPYVDMRESVPEIIPYLSPVERVVDVVYVDDVRPERHPSALRAMLWLTGVERSLEIGTNGPAVASRSNPENEHVPSLNKYEDLFGRDSLRTAGYLQDAYPRLMTSTILELAKYQGVKDEQLDPNPSVPFGQERFGKVPHHVKDPQDPIARKFSAMQGWRWPFYGSIDATPLFINAAHTVAKQDPEIMQKPYVDKNGETQQIETAVNRAFGWLYGELQENDSQGLLWYKNLDTRSPGFGMMNQGWRDSAYAYRHKNGEMANTADGIATLEVQGLTYDALVATALNSNDELHSGEIFNTAESLRRAVLKELWIDDEVGGYFALGADRDDNGEMRPIEVVSSNIGHLLNSSLLDGDDPEITYKREQTVRRLFDEGLLSPQGIRTVSKYEPTFREGAYHSGSVWPWDTYEIACGLERHGYYGLAYDLKKRLHHIVESTNRFPEFVRGGDSSEPELNTTEVYVVNEELDLLHVYEQPPQEVQAWTVAIMLAIKKKHPRLFTEKSTNGRQHQPMPIAAADPAKRQLEQSLLRSLE